MNIITLTTDFGERDYSAGAVKGTLYSQAPDIRIVDISHSVSPYNIFQAAYILKNAYKHFPKGTIHLIGIDAEKTPLQRQLIMKYNGHYFIGADNGILSLICNNDLSDVQLIEIEGQNTPCTFPTLTVLVPIAASLSQGEDFRTLGKITEHRLKEIRPYTVNIASDRSSIIGNVIYIDHYGNAVTNISRKTFEEVRQGRSFKIYIGGISFSKIYNSYNDFVNYSSQKKDIFNIDEGKAILLFNSTDNLELAIYKSNMDTVGGACTLLGIEYRDQISIFFK